jgi:hypothetical protein
VDTLTYVFDDKTTDTVCYENDRILVLRQNSLFQAVLEVLTMVRDDVWNTFLWD